MDKNCPVCFGRRVCENHPIALGMTD
jgi:hypothetical protein